MASRELLQHMPIIPVLRRLKQEDSVWNLQTEATNQVLGQPGLHSETLSQKTQQNPTNKQN
jgi:hypothetical protein